MTPDGHCKSTLPLTELKYFFSFTLDQSTYFIHTKVPSEIQVKLLSRNNPLIFTRIIWPAKTPDAKI